MDQDWITAFEALKSVYIDDAFSNIALSEAISHHKGCRDSFVRMFAKGVIRDTIRLDSIIDELAKGGVRSIKKRTLIVIRMGLYAIRSLNSVPEHAAVSESVELARRVARGTDRFVNAVLREYLRRQDEFGDDNCSLATRYSFPQELADLFTSQYGDEAENIMKGLNDPPPVIIRPNSLKTTASELAASLNGQGFNVRTVDETPLALIAEGSGLLSTREFKEGYFTVQSLSSILAVAALSPEPGSEVLDMCAAPGGKTTMMAELMGNDGSITACDIYEHRLELIRASASRLGIKCISTALLDGTEYDAELEGRFDYVLADVPCSGLGVIGSKPEIKLKACAEEFEELTGVQEAIFRNAIRYAKPGGMIEYSTCTLNKAENEEIVERVLGEGKLASIVEMSTVLPYNNLIGFYYCRIKKNC